MAFTRKSNLLGGTSRHPVKPMRSHVQAWSRGRCGGSGPGLLQFLVREPGSQAQNPEQGAAAIPAEGRMPSHVCIACASCAHCVCIVCSSCVHHVLILCASCVHRALIMCASCPDHVCIMCSSCASCVHRVCIMCASFPVPSAEVDTAPSVYCMRLSLHHLRSAQFWVTEIVEIMFFKKYVFVDF